MNSVLVETLGTVAVEDGSFRQHQPIVLLAYLAHEGPKDRQHLASVFWPEAKKPLNNLSSALSRLRQLSPGAIVIDGSRVGTACSTDAMQILNAIEAGRFDDAIAGYVGRFLDGYQLKSVGIELEEWIFQTRESIAGAISLRAVQRSRDFSASGDVERAADMAETALTISFDGYPLTDHLDYLHSALTRASRSAALRVRAEANAMGIDLTVAEEIGDAAAGDEIAPVESPADNDAGSASTIVGRVDELDELDRLAGAHRLVTVFGFGGIGKTTLVREYLARANARSAVRSVRVDLAANDDIDDVTNLIGSGLGVESGSGPIAGQLGESIVEPVVLFLDDVSPTPEICALADSLIADVDQLSIITTSRPRFASENCGELRLLGLSTEQDGGRSDAADLFGLKAAAALGRVNMDAADWSRVEEVCQSVVGVPLAIELTAAWLRMVPLDEIIKMLGEGALLDQRLPGATTTLEQVIRQSSALLRPELQTALAEISVLRGSFDWLAARSIADVGVSDLAELHDHSMLTLRDQGRMECHPLVVAYAAEQLAQHPVREVELHQSHSRYFLRTLSDAVDRLTGPEQGSALNALVADHDNIVAAWRYAVDEGRWEQLELLIGALDTYLLRSGQLTVARRLFTEAGDRLEMVVGEWQDLRASLANNLAWVHMLLGEATTATRICHETIDRYDDLRLATSVALRRTKAALLSNQGRFDDMLAEYELAIQMVDENDERRLWALLREDIGRAHLLLADVDKARESFRATLDAAREFKDPHMESRSYLMLGKLDIDREPASALVLLDEGERIAAGHGLLHLQSYFSQEQGRAYLLCSKHESATEAFLQGLELAEETGDLYIRAANELGLARVNAALGHHDDARGHFETTTRLAIRINGWSLALGAAIEVASGVVGGASDPAADESALQLLAFATAHPTAFPHDRQRGIAALAGRAPTRTLSPDLRLDETCERVMQLLRYPMFLAETG